MTTRLHPARLAAAAICSIAAIALPATGCTDDNQLDGPPVVVGMLAPTSGALSGTGDMMRQIGQLAVDEINQRGGVGGRPLALVIADTGTSTGGADQLFQSLVDRGAVAIIGPATREQVEQVVPVARSRETVFISPISTTPWDDDRPDDDGFMFRNVASDDIQGLAISYFLRQRADFVPKNAAVIAERSPDAAGLARAFSCFFSKPDPDTGIARVVSDTLLFDRDITDSLSARIVADQIDNLDPIPDVAVLAALEQDALAIINAWVEFGATEDLRWMMTGTAKTPGFLRGAPVEIVRDTGAAPTYPRIGRAFRALERAYSERYDDDVRDLAFATNVWDAVYLLAAAASAQEIDDVEVGGAAMRDALRRVSADGPILHAGQWADLTAILRNGGDVDYDGASGPVDFENNGEVIGPYEVWQLEESGAGLVFAQAVYIDSRNIEQVLLELGGEVLGPDQTLFDLLAQCDDG